jgi:hypothetical protein
MGLTAETWAGLIGDYEFGYVVKYPIPTKEWVESVLKHGLFPWDDPRHPGPHSHEWAPKREPRPNAVYFFVPTAKRVAIGESAPIRVELSRLDPGRLLVEEDCVMSWLRLGHQRPDRPAFSDAFRQGIPPWLAQELDPDLLDEPFKDVGDSLGAWVDRLALDDEKNILASAGWGALAYRGMIDADFLERNPAIP